MSIRERLLVPYMRLAAGLMLLAFPFIFVPHAWMDLMHQRLGLGELPDLPIVRYLTRSASALYALQGALLLYLSFHVKAHRPVIQLLAILGIAFGALVIGIDLTAGLPSHWTWREGPIVLVESSLLLWLARNPSTQPPPAPRTDNPSP